MDCSVRSHVGSINPVKPQRSTQDVNSLQLHLDGSRSLTPSVNESCQVYSPVTDLAMNLGGLSTLSHVKDDTPKRRLCLALCDDMTPTPPLQAIHRKSTLTRQISVDEGCCIESPSPTEEEKPLLKNLKQKKISNQDCLKKNAFQSPATPYGDVPSAAFRRFQAMPVPFCGFDPSPPATKREVRLSDKLTPVTRDHSPESAPTPRRGNLFSPHRPLFCLDSPGKSYGSEEDDENSQDSGVCMDKQDGGEFKCPLLPAPRPRKLSIGTDNATSSPLKYSSSPKCKAMPLSFSNSLFKQSPVKLQQSPLTQCSPAEEGDDGFIELLDVDEDNSTSCQCPKGLEKLFSAPVLSKEEDLTSSTFRARTLTDVTNTENRTDSNSNSKGFRRGLFGSSPCLPKLTRSQTFSFTNAMQKKRCSDPMSCEEDCTTPLRQPKRRKSMVYTEENKENCENNAAYKATFKKPSDNRPKLMRCHSESEALVKAALEKRDNQHLIGDLSMEYALPVVKGKHQDLRSITADTMADLLNGVYSHVVEKFVIVDCRYPYEYEGGHIKGAKNMFTKEEIYNEFIKKQQFKHTTSEGKRNIIIFHCEFSSERGPKMHRFVRSEDRKANKDTYPHLDYPEIYLLDQGYKKFFECHQGLCTPQEYMTMLDKNHEEDLRHFRIKSKSWAGDSKSKGKGRINFRSLKF